MKIAAIIRRVLAVLLNNYHLKKQIHRKGGRVYNGGSLKLHGSFNVGNDVIIGYIRR